MSDLSIIMIVKNEEHDIEKCLETVKWADEIVVFDSNSSDNTCEICRKYTDKIFKTKNSDWKGYGIKKNKALEKASSEWILSIDADERLSDELQNEIKSIVCKKDEKNEKMDFDAYYIPFKDQRQKTRLYRA